MERQRSPSYPSLSLPQAIDLVEKLHKANRTSVISRETAARDMGYAGLTGRSLTVLSVLSQFGLIEKAGKGDIKVSRRAVDILHSIDPADKAEAIQEAAFAPSLFQQLHERFPEGVPSHNALRSYLIQQEFGDVAIGPAIAAFLETNAFAENAKESGSYGDKADQGAESLASTNMDEAMNAHITQPNPTGRTPINALHMSPAEIADGLAKLAGASASRNLRPNEVYLDIRGSREVHVEGLLDYDGILDLEEKIKALKMILKQPPKAVVAPTLVKDIGQAGLAMRAETGDAVDPD